MREFGEQANAFRDAFEAWNEQEVERLEKPHLADVFEEGQRNAIERQRELETAASQDFAAALLPDSNESLRQEIESLRLTKAYRSGFISEKTIQSKLDALPKSEPYTEEDVKFAKAYWIGRLLLSSFRYAGQSTEQTDVSNVAQAVQRSEKASTDPAIPDQETLGVVILQPTDLPQTIFELPNQRRISGKIAQLANLLALSTEQNPVTEQMILEAGIYTQEELGQLNKSKVVLSTLVGSLRNALRRHKVDDQLIIHGAALEGSQGRGTIHKQGYYLEKKQVTTTDVATDTTPEIIEQSVESTERTPLTIERFTMYDAAVLADYIHMRAPLLRQLGLQPLDKQLIEKLDQDLPEINVAPTQSELDIQRARTYNFIRESITSESINKLLDEVGPDDPRSDLLIYIFGMCESDQSRVLFERALRATIKRVARGQSSRRGIQEIEIDYYHYEFDDGSPSINVPYSYVLSETAVPRPEPVKRMPFEDTHDSREVSEPPAQSVHQRRRRRVVQPLPVLEARSSDETAPPTLPTEVKNEIEVPLEKTAPETITSPIENRNEREQDWEKDFKRKIGEAINSLRYDGLMSVDEITASRVDRQSSSETLGTKTNLDRLKSAGLLKYQGDHRSVQLSASQIVCLYLFNTSPQELGKGKPRQKRAMEIIEASVQSFFDHQ